MAYHSKYSGVEVDALLDKIKDDNVGSIDSSLSTTSENPVKNKVITEELNKKANKTDIATINGQPLTNGGNIEVVTYAYDDTEIKGKLTELDSQIDGEATARTNADAELQTQINSKQEALTLTVKDNGNIVLANIQGQSKEFMPATPSGDPMHYAYVAAGAEYNEDTGFWKLGTLDDLTNDELKYMYNIRSPYISGDDEGLYSWKTSRTIFPLNIYGESLPFINISMMFYSSNFLEIPTAVNNTVMKFSGRCGSLFAKCKNLKYIRTKLKFDSLIDSQKMFNLCSSLEEVVILTNSSLYFNDCSKLNTNSVLYMINNEFAKSPITITLHADVYNRCMANADILAALETHTNISLASA